MSPLGAATSFVETAVCLRSDETRSTERQQADIASSGSSTGRGREPAELDQGPLENIESVNEDKRRELFVKLASDSCEMALALVYSDGSTQLREIRADAKVYCLLYVS